jgi:hypothetical protein
MGSDDRVFGPPREGIQDEGVNTQPKPKKPKPFIIERRYIGTNKYLRLIDYLEWHTYRRYPKVKARDEAFNHLDGKLRYGHPSGYEYRKVDNV